MTSRAPVSSGDALGRRERPDIEWVRVESETIVWNAHTEELHRLDPIATLIFDLCDGRTTLSTMVIELAAAFDVEESVIEADVLSGSQVLLDAGLLTRS